ncbi:cysteine proteinase inhibitor 5-like [Cucumis melo var. makuwa]|uniref:Cysteine proteinase inhibitor 5-like n=2 Tax=Cucumis melo TaxID=3656 RepID=A0A5A7TGI6_CUCMM|nr:cysteine proteinase inhibitor 5-like [Cucumis melo var. makuwa]TYK07890.1 cysteine proteinase inhibitor 5-like [Cucumis melo var. makuwa]
MASDIVSGGYTPVENPQSPRMKELAEWAIAEHNKKEGTHLRFISILTCESQIVNGVNYRFTLTAKNDYDNCLPGKYMAIVYEQPSECFKELVFFKQLLLDE